MTAHQAIEFFDEPCTITFAKRDGRAGKRVQSERARRHHGYVERVQTSNRVVQRGDELGFLIIQRRLLRPWKMDKADTGEELLECKDLMLYSHLYTVRNQRELDNLSYDVFELSDMDDFCEITKKIINSGGYCHVFCSALKRFAW